MNAFGGFRFATPTLQLQNATDIVFVFHRLRICPFDGPANGKPPALPEVFDSFEQNHNCCIVNEKNTCS